ncbi:MBL fold metallo-hydrolase [Swaminathania salitolerans]|uniref:MBL fold metallo-hydrolase n=1 Tax=Swaminathania salitolerans TaxID=182838 RepID=A0A511BRC5_9PROT|nr:MBL fold metallo-hydrolase [Swaminathania salitolerans]GBQ12497.1 metallo-beta-lactamase [Swaminathania salitolerans LMG 21291]GEL02869.1 MBL fold metallo-hydrolase [Swaminathania salitolerans]
MHARTVKVTPLRQNCTVLECRDTGHALVVDPGGDVPELLGTLEGLEVDGILLTHGHFDHVGGAEALRDALSRRQGKRVPLIGPDRRDAFLLGSVVEQAEAFGLSGLENAHPDRFVSDGETLDFPMARISVAHCPGHTPGHVVFIAHEHRIAVVGDTLFRGVVGRTDFAYGDHKALVEGIRRCLLSLDDDFIVLPGHGLPSTIGEERRSNPFLT